MTTDPIGFGGDVSNRYASAHSAPTNLVDPDGKDVDCVRTGKQIDRTLQITYPGLRATDENIREFNITIIASRDGQSP